MTRAVLYARYSSDNQREASIEDQLRIYREREVIRDSHLLRVMFHRMVLRIVDGNDHCYDYDARRSPDFAIRNLRDPVLPDSGHT